MGLRIDEGVYQGFTVSPYYESLLLKLMSWGNSRDEAVSRMKRALDELKIEGIKTNQPMLRIALEDPLFISGEYCTDFIERQQLVKRVREQQANSIMRTS
jgi:acetyl/propionyl-CoA carboxylase alpha subunit